MAPGDGTHAGGGELECMYRYITFCANPDHDLTCPPSKSPIQVLGHSHGIIQGPRTERAAIDAIIKATHARLPTFSVTLINYTKSGQPFENVLTVHRRLLGQAGAPTKLSARVGAGAATAPAVGDMLLAVSQVRHLPGEESAA